MDFPSLLRQSYGSYGYGYGWQRFESARRTVHFIMGVNVVVFGAWTYASYHNDSKLRDYLMENATLSWSSINLKRYWTTLTSAFSHQDFSHLLFNMMSLNAFASALVYAGNIGVGAPHIIGLYCGSAIAGSAAYLYMRKPQKHDRRWGLFGHHIPTTLSYCLGASGAVMGFASAATLLAPFSKMMILPLPVPIPMWLLTSAYFAVDYYYLGANDRIGHDAHLGGAVFGVAYYLAALRGYGGISQTVRRLVSRR